MDENRINKNLKAFSFPRIYGSDAERKAYKIAKDKIEKLNLTAHIQKFSFTNFYSIYYSRIMLTLIFCLLFIFYLNFGGLFQGIIISILLILFIFAYIISLITRKPDKLKIGKQFHSQNLYVNINSNINKKDFNNIKKEVIFLAHLDSKSQRFNVVNRVKIFGVWLYSIFISAIFIILKNFFFTQYTLFLYIFGVIPLALNLITVILTFTNKTTNDSYGALDNGSGIACVLELLNYYSAPEMRLKNLNLWFVLTGAEESGTQGVRKFYKVLKDLKKEKDKFIIINFDGIGTKLDLIKFGLTTHNTFNFQNIFLTNAENINLKINKRRVPVGVHTDGYYLFKKKYRGLEFGDWDSHKYIHTINDTIDKVDASLLKKVCEIVTASLNEIDELY